MDLEPASVGGKLMGALMKDHKDELDGSLARQLATKILAES